MGKNKDLLERKSAIFLEKKGSIAKKKGGSEKPPDIAPYYDYSSDKISRDSYSFSSFRPAPIKSKVVSKTKIPSMLPTKGDIDSSSVASSCSLPTKNIKISSVTASSSKDNSTTNQALSVLLSLSDIKSQNSSHIEDNDAYYVRVPSHGAGFSNLLEDRSSIIVPIDVEKQELSSLSTDDNCLSSVSSSPVLNIYAYDNRSSDPITIPCLFKFTLDEEQTKILKDLEVQLQDIVLTLKKGINENAPIDNSIVNNSKINPKSVYSLGMAHKKLAHVYNLYNFSEKSTYQRELALDYINKAISLTEIYQPVYPASTTNTNADLAKYYASKAKCLYYMHRLIEAQESCMQSIRSMDNPMAHDCLGYILREQGHYKTALKEFKLASKIKNYSENYHSYIKNHSIVSLYNKSVTLAAIGNITQSLAHLDMAKALENPKTLDLEDQILALEISKPKYETLLRVLSSQASILSSENLRSPSNTTTDSSISENFIENHKQPLISTTATGAPNILKLSPLNGKASDQIIAEETLMKASPLLQKNTNKHPESSPDKAPDGKPPLYMPPSNQAKLQRLSNKFDDLCNSDETAVNLDDIFTDTIKNNLIDTYDAVRIIRTQLVPNNKTGNTGHVAKGVGILKDLTPDVIKAPLFLVSIGLGAVDEYKQLKCIENFYNLASSREDMLRLSNEIAHQLLSHHQQSKISSSDEPDLESRKKYAEEIFEIIKTMAFNGNFTPGSSANKIVELALIKQAHNSGLELKPSIELPLHTLHISQLVLKGIKQSIKPSIVWKDKDEKEALELRFVDYLAYSIYVAKIPSNVDCELFAATLANSLSKKDDIVEVQSRIFHMGQKAALSNKFLERVDYFNKDIEFARDRIIQAGEDYKSDDRFNNSLEIQDYTALAGGEYIEDNTHIA